MLDAKQQKNNFILPERNCNLRLRIDKVFELEANANA
jgi:hypothetical protein